MMQAAASHAARRDEAEEAWFVYGLLPVAAPPPAAGAAAILPAVRVERLPLGRIAVLASRVPRWLFDRDDARNRTADPDWIGGRVQAYHDVNAEAAAAGPFLPLAFGTLFSSLDLLQDWVTPREAVLRAALGRLADCTEWSLSLQADAAAHGAWLAAHDARLRDLADAVARAGEGTAFLLARRLDSMREAARAAHLASAAARVTATLAQAGCRVLDPPGRAGAAWSLLVPNDDAGWSALLDPLADELGDAGLSLRLTGPWAAYAFARAALAEEVADV